MKKEILNKSKKLKILISVYACEPNKGSEPGVGWNWVNQIARFHQVWVITRFNNRSSIEAEVKKNQMKDVHWIFYDLPNWCLKWKNGKKRLKIYYFLWQFFVAILAFKYNRKIKFDISHHVTFNGLSYPTFLWLLPVPFVWGPIGGGQITNPIFMHLYGNRKIKELFRTLLVRLSKFNPFIILESLFAQKILVANDDTLKRFVVRTKTTKILETAIDKIYHERKIKYSSKIRILWIGDIEPHKALFLALKSLYLIKELDYEFIVVGQGNEQEKMQSLVNYLGIKDKVSFIGRIPHNEVYQYYSNSDIFLFTSIRDTSGNVVLEAMSFGLPCIVLNHQGVKDIISEECGIKIEISDINNVIEGIADALKRLMKDPKLRYEMGRNGRMRIENLYTWDKKGEFINQIYQEVLANQ